MAHDDSAAPSFVGRLAALCHAIHPPVRVRRALGRAGVLSGQPRADRSRHRSAADVDAARRHARLAVPHHAGRPHRPPADADRRRGADGGRRRRLRLDAPDVAPRRSPARSASSARAGRKSDPFCRSSRPRCRRSSPTAPERGVRLVHAGRFAGDGARRAGRRLPDADAAAGHGRRSSSYRAVVVAVRRARRRARRRRSAASSPRSGGRASRRLLRRPGRCVRPALGHRATRDASC